MKVVLNTERMAARSEGMFPKEVRLSVVAYNLIGQLRRRAGYERVMGYAVRDRLPKRSPGRRSEREAYPRRPKAAQLKKRKPRPPADGPPM